ncbi:MAG: phenylalanine--tRNA ligase subunit beta [Chloroflexi bacterium]|nr:phenylalanine--tRNA ligase subunit beta [Chloroflexota bacterium]
MLVPLSWLKDYVRVDLPVEKLADRLTLGGVEVKTVERIGETWDREAIFVGQVLGVRQHPNADRLVLVTVEYGAAQPLEVVTGAPNLRVGDAGQKVVLAIVGATLIDPYADTLKYQKLKRSKIRGVPSEGMVCSEKELGISNEHEGIIILPEDAPVGMPLADYWGDQVLDLDLTPNVARAACLVGVAREAAALAGGHLTVEEPAVVAEGAPLAGRLALEIRDPDLCRRYSAALIEGVRIGPSPEWMQRRLRLAGMRPINNIVDITNYVMLEWGQPLHAFDYRLLRPHAGEKIPAIIVRRAHDGEKMVTLDGVTRTFDGDMLLITDGGGPVGIAGIMGGLESEVTDATVDVLLEAANFDFINVRRTTGELKIPSEAAQRFGRGVDPELTLVALRRAAELMRTLAGGTVAAGFEDLYPAPPEVHVLDLPVAEVTRLLGIQVDAAEIAAMLSALGFGCEVVAEGDAAVRVTVPSGRLDVRLEADLVEEVARMVGYDRLPSTLIDAAVPPQTRNRPLELEERTRDILVGAGLTETISYSLTSVESVARLVPGGAPPAKEAYVRLANPLTREQEVLRQTLMDTTLETVARNLRFVERVPIFEIARIYLPVEGEPLPQEPTMLSIALTGPREVRSWLAADSPALDFYDLKGIIEELCEHLGIAGATYAPAEHPTFRPGRVASLSVDGEELGVFGEVHPTVAAAFDMAGQPVYLAEIALERLLAKVRTTEQFVPISPMPAVKEDLALVVAEEVPSDEVGRLIREAGGELLAEVVLFDVYRGAQVGEAKKSLAYSLSFQSATKTLTGEETAKFRARIVKRLEEAFGAQIRA